MSRNRLEPVSLRHAQCLLLRAVDNPLRNRVLGITFDRRRNPKRLVRTQASIRGDVDDPELAPRQGAGLVEDHRSEVPRLLEATAIADEQSRLCTETGGDGRHQRHGESECVRAGDDEHGDQPFNGKGACRSDRQPYDKGERARDDGDDGQCESGAVSQRLRTRSGRLRLFDQPHDVRERGTLAGARHRHAEGAGAVDGASDDFFALDLWHWHRLAGDHRFIDVALAALHDAIGGHARAWSHEDDVAFTQHRDRHIFDRLADDALRRAGQQLRQLAQGT